MRQTAALKQLSFDQLETRLSSLSEIVLDRLETEVQETAAAQDWRRYTIIRDVVDEYKKVNPTLKSGVIAEATRISYDAHHGHKRKSGLPYIVHPYQVGYLLALMGMDSETVAAGLNHDAIEKSAAKRKEITERIIESLGDTVLGLVMGVTRVAEEEIYSTNYDVVTQDKLLEMMKNTTQDVRIDAINVAYGISNLLSIEGLRVGSFNHVDTRAKSLANSEHYVLPAALRLDAAFGANGNFKFYDFVNVLILRGKANL